MNDIEVLADRHELSVEEVGEQIAGFMDSVRLLERLITDGTVGVRGGAIGWPDGAVELAFNVPAGFVVCVSPQEVGGSIAGLSTIQGGFSRFDEPEIFDQEHPFTATRIEAIFQGPEDLADGEGRLRISFVREPDEATTEIITTADMSEFDGFKLDVVNASIQE